MKQKLFVAIEILFESMYFLVITYTLSSWPSLSNMMYMVYSAGSQMFMPLPNITLPLKNTLEVFSGLMCCLPLF